ncbi:PTS transporter subunit EIIC [Cytobacillus firmus]|uniref:PTS transporter subunit EIIC n=1 Tax=Cytobacillus firmus TaxID=1399 RepID=UPI00222814AC|nr:PTS transporter subunit EIIC [Cytobacillus firmus]
MRKEERLAKEITEQLGGTGNIAELASCMTRLRVKPVDESKVNLNGIKDIDGVMGVVEAETLQIILGPGIVTKVADEVSRMTGKNVSSVDDDDEEIDTSLEGLAARTKAGLNEKNATPFKLFLRKIASIFIPLIPAIVASGLIAGINNVIIKSGGDPESTLVQMLDLIGWGLFGYLGVFVGINTAKEFGGSPALGGAAGILLINPGLANITLFGEALVPGRGGLIGVMLAAALVAFLEKRIRKVVPSAIDIIVTPTLALLITGFATFFVLQPVGGFLSDIITKGLLGVLDVGGILAGLVLAGTFLPLVVTGLHQGLTPVHMELINSIGDDPLLPILAMGGAGQVGAAFAIYFKTKNARLKKVIKGGLPVGMLGIGEPLIFGVTLPLGRPFLTACLGAAVGGAFQAFFKIATVAIGVSGIPLAFLVHTNQIVLYLIGLLIAYAFGFLFTWLFGFKEEMAKNI